MLSFKIKKIGNHWYPSVNHDLGYIVGFEEKIDKYLNILDIYKCDELTVEFDEIGVIFEGTNIIYFNEKDIVRYLETDDNFDLSFVVNNHDFKISSDIYYLLETQFNFNFHKTSYSIHIY